MVTDWPRALPQSDGSVEKATVMRMAAVSLAGRAEQGKRVMEAFLVMGGSAVSVGDSVAR
jgi:hypothetical protein